MRTQVDQKQNFSLHIMFRIAFFCSKMLMVMLVRNTKSGGRFFYFYFKEASDDTVLGNCLLLFLQQFLFLQGRVMVKVSFSFSWLLQQAHSFLISIFLQ